MFQVNSVIDVGVSAYSQLQKLKGQEIDVTDSDKAKKNVRVECDFVITYLQRSANFGQISNVAANFLVSLTHFRSNKSKW